MHTMSVELYDNFEELHSEPEFIKVKWIQRMRDGSYFVRLDGDKAFRLSREIIEFIKEGGNEDSIY